MSVCAWCRRENSTSPVSFWYGDLQAELGPTCARLLAPESFVSDLHQELDVLDIARCALDQRFSDVYASGDGTADRCWWCARPGAAADVVASLGGEVLFERPVLCDVCLGLSGHVGGGSAYVDETRQAAQYLAFDVLLREQEPPNPALREANEEMLIVKLFLLEHDPDRVSDYPGDGYGALRASLGLSEEEVRAQVLRLWDEPDSPVTFARLDGQVIPVLSELGRARFAELRRDFDSGPPYGNPALRRRSLQRAFHVLDAVTVGRR